MIYKSGYTFEDDIEIKKEDIISADETIDKLRHEYSQLEYISIKHNRRILFGFDPNPKYCKGSLYFVVKLDDFDSENRKMMNYLKKDNILLSRILEVPYVRKYLNFPNRVLASDKNYENFVPTLDVIFGQYFNINDLLKIELSEM